MVSNLTNIKNKKNKKTFFLQITELKNTMTYDVGNTGR